jgi:hypothetical protein
LARAGAVPCSAFGTWVRIIIIIMSSIKP